MGGRRGGDREAEDERHGGAWRWAAGGTVEAARREWLERGLAPEQREARLPRAEDLSRAR